MTGEIGWQSERGRVEAGEEDGKGKAIRTWAIPGYYGDVRDVSSIILIAEITVASMAVTTPPPSHFLHSSSTHSLPPLNVLRTQQLKVPWPQVRLTFFIPDIRFSLLFFFLLTTSTIVIQKIVTYAPSILFHTTFFFEPDFILLIRRYERIMIATIL